MEKATKDRRKSKSVPLFAIAAFLLTLTLCSLLICVTASHRTRAGFAEMEKLAARKSAEASETIARLLSKTHTLSAFVSLGGGSIEHFDLAASSIIDDPSIAGVLLAPSGVVSDVWPVQGNESLVGLNLLSGGALFETAAAAKESSGLTMGGPVSLESGGQVLAGCLPIFTSAPDGTRDFWGFTAVLLKYPQVLDDAGVSELTENGFTFEIWQPGTPDGERSLIADGGPHEQSRFVEKPMPILNVHWYLRVFPIGSWIQYPETKTAFLAGLLISLAVAFAVQNNRNMKQLQSKLEEMAYTDGLTGVLNRRHFMELAAAQMDRASRTKSSGYVIFFDIDHFKRVNDTYGHTAGDAVLKVIAQRARDSVRPYDLFARYGGEEFIIVVTDVDGTVIESIAHRIRRSIEKTPVLAEGQSILVTASFGVAPIDMPSGLQDAISLADKALYKAKADGRNRVVVCVNGEFLQSPSPVPAL